MSFPTPRDGAGCAPAGALRRDGRARAAATARHAEVTTAWTRLSAAVATSAAAGMR
jgi:hypothetical protein